MNKSHFFFLLFFLISFQSHAILPRPLSRFYKLVPESKAHVVFKESREAALPSDSIKALVWNIKKAQMKPWRDEFVKYSFNKDLFLLQEAYSNTLFNTTLEEMPGFRWDMGISFLYRIYGDTPTGNMVGSDVGPSFVKVLHTKDREPVVETPKATTFAKYPLSGSPKELLVISVHGINITSYSAFARHMLQIKKEIDNHDGPVLWAGDFNTRTAARTKYVMDLMKEMKFDTTEFTNGHCRMRFKFTPYYLDHSFTRGLKVLKADVDCNSIGSDHKPLFLELAALP